MPISYPASYDALTNPTSGSALTSPSHAAQHSDANDVIEALERRAGLSGVAFPGSPTSGDRFYRTDRRIEYEYNGTGWVSTTLYDALIDLSGTAAATGTGIIKENVLLPRPSGYLIRTEGDFQAIFAVAAGGSALSASHSWSIQLNRTPADASFGSVLVNSGASGGTVRREEAIGGSSATASGTIGGYVLVTKTGTPGNLTVFGIGFSYRLLG